MDKQYTGVSGFYAQVVPQSIENLRALYHQVTKADMPENGGELHATVMYSKAALKVSPARAHEMVEQSADAIYQATVLAFDFWPGHDNKGYFVVRFASNHLTMRHNVWKQCGAIPTFEQYDTHMTVLTGPEAIEAAPFIPLLNAAIKAGGVITCVFTNETINDLKD